jgi:soluble lytic murein transglycosylase
MANVEAASDEVRAALRRMIGGARRLRRVRTAQLLAYVRAAARGSARPELDAALQELNARRTGCVFKVEAGILAGGTASDAVVEHLLTDCLDAPGELGIEARYHRARALLRAGQTEEAVVEFQRVRELDGTNWYGLWATQLLNTVAEPVGAPPTTVARSDGGDPKEGGGPVVRGVDDGGPRAFDPALEARLEAVASTHGQAFPWIVRCLSLVRLGSYQDAADELHEAFVAWHEARGRPVLRAGLEAVFRGRTPARIRVPSRDIMRARRALDDDAAGTLADVADGLGDPGLAIRFGGRARAADRPRPYEALVVASAHEHGLDPNLLFAVMRVESVYNPRIVSYAGAIGLLQIMPGTGRLIAQAIGRAEFRVDELLDPATNIEFAAWYLASLLRRFDGRVPLAVAAYNGGPHNVRAWMRETPAGMPLDAFLERIPFGQTNRYVRRVLVHWSAYRRALQLPMPRIDPTLPALAPDRVGF